MSSNNTTLEYLGISGWALGILSVLWYIARKVFKSQCVRGADGNLHIDLSLNTTELNAIATDENLKKLFKELKDEIGRQAPQHRDHPSASVAPSS